jgi:hypothetical protein
MAVKILRQLCSICGMMVPYPVEYNHSEEECKEEQERLKNE